MAISRVTAQWTGFTGAPGYTNLFFDAFGGGDQVDAELARALDFFIIASETMPEPVRIQLDTEVAILEETSGALIGYGQSSDIIPAVAGKAAGNYAAPAGGLIQWNTETVARGRRLRGRTFIVPMASNQYQPDGTLSAAAIEDLNDAALALIGDGTGPQPVIWSRPRTGADGSIGAITSFRIPDQVAILSSRRD